MKNVIIASIFGLLLIGGTMCTFEKPNLPKQQESQPESKDSIAQQYLSKGKKIATQTQKVLGKNLMGAIEKGGPSYALDFCNVKAIPLTDSMSNELNTSIKRVSDKNRNPNNSANATEQEYIAWAKRKIKEQSSISPKVQQIDGRWVGYYPIVTNPMCLKCHGQPQKDIQPATLAKIDEYYPEDQAQGYGVNEVRGVWVITFDD